MNFFCACLLAIAGAVTLTSCAPSLYSTVGQNVPLFHEKGEFAVNIGGVSAATNSDGFYPFYNMGGGLSLHGAVAVDSGIALITSFYTLENTDGDWDVRGTYFELGGGLFKFSPRSEFVGELFGGVGYGSFHNQADYEKIDATFIKYFIQPSGGFSTKVVDFAFTPRIAIVHYLSRSPSARPEVNEFFDEKGTSFVFEPGVTVRAGFRNFKAQYQMNYSTMKFSRSYPNSEDFDPVMDCYSSLSLFIIITDRWKR